MRITDPKIFSFVLTDMYESKKAPQKLERVMRYVKASVDINGMGNRTKIVAGRLKYHTGFLLVISLLIVSFQCQSETRRYGAERLADTEPKATLEGII